MTLIGLSVLDYVYSGGAFAPTTFALRYTASLDLDRLAAAFCITARQFVGVNGVLVEQDSQTLAFDVSQDAAEITLDRSPVDSQQIVPVGFAQTKIGKPLVRVRLSRLSDGGTLVAMSLSHVVGDGYSLFLFLAAWGARARAAEGPAPNCNRTILRAPTAAQNDVRSEDISHTGLFLVPDGTPEPELVMRERRWVPPATAENEGVSRNDILCVALWRESLAYVQSETTTLSCVVDMRRHQQELGSVFFGNAVLPATVTASRARLTAASSHEIIGWLRAALEDAPRRLSAALCELDALRVARGHEVFKRVRSMPVNGLTVTNLERIPKKVLDFGAGPPAQVAPLLPSMPAPVVLVLPGDSGELRLWSSAS